MDEHGSINHSKWECKYHVVFIPTCRRKTLYVQLRQYPGGVFRRLAEQKESRIEEGHLMSDHVHMMISMTPTDRHAQAILTAIMAATIPSPSPKSVMPRPTGQHGPA